MRKLALRLVALAGIVVLGACGDSPTAENRPHDLAAEAPLLDQTVSGCVSDPDGVCTLDPVSPAPSEPQPCDPYVMLNGCGDEGDCMSSTEGSESQATMTCGEPREPVDYKPPPSEAPKPCPDYGCPPPEPEPVPRMSDDYASQDSLPNCSNAPSWNKPWHLPYCTGTAPTGTTLTKYNSELDAMAAVGGFCSELAEWGRYLLTVGGVRYYTGTTPDKRSWGGSIGIIMDSRFITAAPPYDHRFALAHELEHSYTNYRHTAADVDANGVQRTPNDGTCG